MFLGDYNAKNYIHELKGAYSALWQNIRVIQVPHHGSKNSNLPEFFDVVSPNYSIFSYGKNNNYGHPNQETINSIKKTGSEILKTGESGQIDIYLYKDNIDCWTYVDKR